MSATQPRRDVRHRKEHTQGNVSFIIPGVLRKSVQSEFCIVQHSRLQRKLKHIAWKPSIPQYFRLLAEFITATELRPQGSGFCAAPHPKRKTVDLVTTGPNGEPSSIKVEFVDPITKRPLADMQRAAQESEAESSSS
jgi:hypothetical protein